MKQMCFNEVAVNQTWYVYINATTQNFKEAKSIVEDASDLLLYLNKCKLAPEFGYIWNFCTKSNDNCYAKPIIWNIILHPIKITNNIVKIVKVFR